MRQHPCAYLTYPALNYAPCHGGTWGSEGTVQCILLNLGTGCRGIFSFMSCPLYPQGKNAQYPLDRRLGV